MIQNIIFDFDGTLVDTAPLIIKTMQATMTELNLPAKNETECRSTIGLRLEDIPAALWPDHPEIKNEYAITYRRIFNNLKHSLNATCFPDVESTIRTLHELGYGMAIASSRSHRSLEEYVTIFGIADCFTLLIGGDDVDHGKPAPDPVFRILGTLNWNSDETLVVGDAAVDIQMGKSAGTQTCAVCYGNGTLSELEYADPNYIIPDFKSLLSVISTNA